MPFVVPPQQRPQAVDAPPQPKRADPPQMRPMDRAPQQPVQYTPPARRSYQYQPRPEMRQQQPMYRAPMPKRQVDQPWYQRPPERQQIPLQTEPAPQIGPAPETELPTEDPRMAYMQRRRTDVPWWGR